MEETLITMPTWLNMTLAIATAFGGIELLKWLASLRAHRRRDRAQAKQEEASAAQSDTDWRQKELELMTSFVNTAKGQYDDLTRRYDDLKGEKEEDRRIKQELRLKVSEHERKIDGLQRAFTESESRRIAAERLYCSVESCTNRRPPIGTYDSSKPVPRRKNGQFAPRKAAMDDN